MAVAAGVYVLLGVFVTVIAAEEQCQSFGGGHVYPGETQYFSKEHNLHQSKALSEYATDYYWSVPDVPTCMCRWSWVYLHCLIEMFLCCVDTWSDGSYITCIMYFWSEFCSFYTVFRTTSSNICPSASLPDALHHVSETDPKWHSTRGLLPEWQLSRFMGS